MTHRQRVLAVLRNEAYDRLPLLHFGFLDATLCRWHAEGHLSDDELAAARAGDGTIGEQAVAARLGFDGNYHTHLGLHGGLRPGFEGRVLEELPGGYRKVLTGLGAIQLHHPDNQSIPAEVDHLLHNRQDWEEHYLPKLQWAPERVTESWLRCPDGDIEPSKVAGYLARQDREWHVLLHCGSLYGFVRDLVGVEGLAYLQADDPDLYEEILATVADIAERNVALAIELGLAADIGHFWEDICFKTGPLVNPRTFDRLVGPTYGRIAALLAAGGLDLVSVDCDGCIDSLLPTWIENGVQVMFPIEVGTWRASLTPWRERYGDRVKGVGGLDKKVFARDRAAVDAEIERLRPIIDSGGYLPCPDHRLPHDNEWDNVRHYCDAMRAIFG